MSSDTEWAREMLQEVSRTFALGIGTLPPPLEEWVTTAYLLCRVVDTVEDDPALPWATRVPLFDAFDHALATGDTTAFLQRATLFSNTPDGHLSQHLDRVIAPLHDAPPAVQQAMCRWIGEMSAGMAIYARRHGDGDTRTTLIDGADLDRYCWYVAGTVGHLLTDLFVAGRPDTEFDLPTLHASAGALGLLLQMTNIVKDVTVDWQRNWCFIPQTFCQAQGIDSSSLLDPAHAQAAQAAVDGVNARAMGQYSAAVDYIAALPKDDQALRRFCLFPMLLASQTLELARGNPAVLDPNNPVKVGRDVVASTLSLVEDLLDDEAAIRALAITPQALA